MSKVRKRSQTSRKKFPQSEGNPSKIRPLSLLDIAVAITFLGSLVLCVIAFSTAKHPISESFVIAPTVIGLLVGAATGLSIWKISKFESMTFLLVVTAIMGAAVAVGVVLAFNRPFDRSTLTTHIVKVVTKYDQGSDDSRVYYLEVENFPLKHILIDSDVYNGVKPGETVELGTRKGFFGFPYLDRVSLVKAGRELGGSEIIKLPQFPQTGSPMSAKGGKP